MKPLTLIVCCGRARRRRAGPSSDAQLDRGGLGARRPLVRLPGVPGSPAWGAERRAAPRQATAEPRLSVRCCVSYPYPGIFMQSGPRDAGAGTASSPREAQGLPPLLRAISECCSVLRANGSSTWGVGVRAACALGV